MSASEIIASFSQDVHQALTKALDTKGKELDAREKSVNKREEKLKAREEHLNRIFTNHNGKQRVIVQVGNSSFETTYDILLSCPDSYFHIFQWTKENELVESPDSVFIARNPTTFGYVLEYLTYGELHSELSDKGLLNMLIADAKFYALPKLAQKVQDCLDSLLAVEGKSEQRLKALEEASLKSEQEISKALKDVDAKVTTLSSKILGQQPPLYHKVAAANQLSNGQYINWNTPILALASHLQYDGSSAYTILKKCLLQLTVRYTATCSTHGNGAGNVNLMVNGIAVARCYHGQANGYQESREMQDIREYNVDDKIQFQYYSNSSTVNDVLGTTLTIIVLHTY